MENEILQIVLADDDEADRLLFLEAFGELKLNTQIHTVNDGTELMDYLINRGGPTPYLLFLDINMPKKNGLECLKEIRANNKFKDISIAIYSTSSSDLDIEDAFVNGANVYIRKPNNFNDLKEVLRKAVVDAKIYKSPPFNISNFLLKI